MKSPIFLSALAFMVGILLGAPEVSDSAHREGHPPWGNR